MEYRTPNRAQRPPGAVRDFARDLLRRIPHSGAAIEQQLRLREQSITVGARRCIRGQIAKGGVWVWAQNARHTYRVRVRPKTTHKGALSAIERCIWSALNP